MVFSFALVRTNLPRYVFFVGENMSFLHGASVFADSASGALEGIIGKTKMLRDMGYSTHSKLHHPVLDCVREYGVTKGSRKMNVSIIRQLDDFWDSMNMRLFWHLLETWGGTPVKSDARPAW